MDNSQSNKVGNQLNKEGGVNDTTGSPLLLFQPFNIVVFLSFYSPIILAMSMIIISFMSQNTKGFIYLGFLIAASIVRTFAYHYSGAQPLVFDNTICTSIQYSKYGNSTFSVFIFSFTLMYIFLPMFVNGGDNYWIFSFLLFYSFLDMMIKFYKKCITSISDISINILSGLCLGALIVSLMYAGGSGKFLFFNEGSSSNTEVCTMPSKQTFKCSVYKNGELVSGA